MSPEMHHEGVGRPTFAVRTLGCRVNQYESRALADTLVRVGWRETPEADALHVIVNVCAVTEKGSRKARRLVYHLCRAAPARRVYVMGCATRTDRAAYLGNPHVRAVVPPAARESMLRILTGRPAHVALQTFGARTRAYVKVQDGCSRACTYCIVPLLRGASRSRSADAIAAECCGLLARGTPEIWIVGTHIEDWSGGELPALLDRIGPLFDGAGGRARIGSLGVDALTDELLGVVGRHRGICRHLHLSLQSGSDRIRRRMGRRGGADAIRARITRCRELLPEVTFTGDILVGFPGEEEDDFEATVALCREIGFVRMHIFPFSSRPGTAAARFAVRPSADTAARCARLKAVERELFAAQAAKLVGRTLRVVVERVGAIAEGFSEEYVRVRFAPGSSRKGTIATVRATDLQPPFLWGEIVEEAGA